MLVVVGTCYHSCREIRPLTVALLTRGAEMRVLKFWRLSWLS